MKVSYYPGCTLKTKAKNLEDAAVASMAALGVEFEELPRWNCCVEARIANALVSYGVYLEKMVWPVELAFFYPWREVISPGQLSFSVFLIAGMTAFVLWGAERWPYLPVGWMWYILTLVPVIGIVQVGYQAMADRYAYIPMIGIFIMVAWGIPDLFASFHDTMGYSFSCPQE